MIVSKCPLRISLAGGSTDLQAYLDKYKSGSVVSFPANLYTYIILNEVKMRKEHRIVYSKIEHVDASTPEKISNDIVRSVFTHFDVPPLEITFTSDIPSTGSGLAASSSYLVALISAVARFKGIKMSQYEICKLAVQLERTFNPLTGYQDAYGCGIGSLKKMTFNPNGLESIEFLEATAFKEVGMYLYPTNQCRSSTTILGTLDLDKVHKMATFAESMSKHIHSDYFICQSLKLAWSIKKTTSPDIITPEIESIEKMLESSDARCFKLLGAGGGGYFLVFFDRTRLKSDFLEIAIDNNGVTTTEI